MYALPLVPYALALVAYTILFARRDAAAGRAATALLVAGAMAHTFVIGMQTMEAGHVPFAGTTQAISTFVWLLALAYLYTEVTTEERGLGIFVLLEALGAAAREINDNRTWTLLGIWRDMHRIGEWCFGARTPDRIPTGPQCAAVLAGVCIVCLIVIIRRVRAVEIVR